MYFFSVIEFPLCSSQAVNQSPVVLNSPYLPQYSQVKADLISVLSTNALILFSTISGYSEFNKSEPIVYIGRRNSAREVRESAEKMMIQIKAGTK